MIPEQVAFQQEAPTTGGLRSRKKHRTRLAIVDAAMTLFEANGYEATTVEQVAELAEVSPTTCFRYFPTKADLVLSDHGEHLSALFEAIVDRPASESDLVAVERAIQEAWVALIDTERTVRRAGIIATSPILRGLSFDRGYRWLTTITDALQERHGAGYDRHRCQITGRVALGVLAASFERWIAEGCRSDLGAVLEASFDDMSALCAEWVHAGAR